MSPTASRESGFRQVSLTEIATLESRGCSCADWTKVRVSDRFDPSRVRNSAFSGDVRLGAFDSDVALDSGLKRPSGVYDSFVHNSTVADNALVSRVGQLVNYDVESGVIIDNVKVLAVRGTTSFGNGVKIEILNEGGGRELPLYDRLSSQVAYLMVVYRHDAALVDALGKMAEKITQSRTSDRGLVARGTKILNAGQIVNVRIGPFATIDGALHLEEGTFWGCEQDPSFVGEGVVARKFIIQSGSRVENSAMLSGVLVGQGVRMGKQYSAENSAFFANCEGFHGEAVSLFAGPYTVTHHKSTLLIAGLFSFYNAGSGSNQSNHMYKLGPLHQGVLQRGSKTGSFSYMLWPNRVGAFTAVIGKHYSNFDTVDLPFSYIVEGDHESVLIPAMNLSTVGTRRDAAKWPARDRRKDSDKLDLVHFDFFGPYVVSGMERAVKVLTDLDAKADTAKEFVSYSGVQIKRAKLKSAAEQYGVGLKAALGKAVLDRLGDMKSMSLADVRKKLTPSFSGDVSQWCDLSGLFAPKSQVQKLASGVGAGAVADLEGLTKELKSLFASYSEASWAWFSGLLERMYGTPASSITAETLAKIVNDWKDASVKLNNLIAKDASKEFNQETMTGFGVDGDESVKKADFAAVRGTFEKNKFVKELSEENAAVEKTAAALVSLIGNLK